MRYSWAISRGAVGLPCFSMSFMAWPKILLGHLALQEEIGDALILGPETKACS